MRVPRQTAVIALLVCSSIGMSVLCAGEAAAAPAWAAASGIDRYGRWAELRVRGTQQRFRLIPAGRFTMGSSPAERAAAAVGGVKEDWMSGEAPHGVTLTRPFWLAETACTQELWQAVTGANPSNFTGNPRRPVEQVSYDDCRAMLATLNAQMAEAQFRLPSEAEWEFACRAGTTAATYVGDIVYLGLMNAPVLDAIAWYSGNSGVGPEDAAAIDSSSWTDRQFPSAFSATHPVGTKRPNGWGLYDMIGNVWVWCGDWYADYPAGDVVDPHGPDTGSDRVCRGGSWGLAAWYCRAAERIRNAPGSRWNSLGLRLCASAAP